MANRRSAAAACAAVAAACSVLLPTAPAAAHYVVASGDTLSGIALRHRTTVPAIAQANAIDDRDRIVVGQSLAIPDADDSSPSAQGVAVSAGASEDQPIPAGGRSDPVVRERVGRLLEETARRYGWRSATIKALALHESGWNNGVVSSTGAIGIMQIMPATGDWLSQYVLRRPLDLRDHADNVEAGVAYLDYLYRQFDRDIERALAAYYEGYRRVQQRGISEGGQAYVDAVLALRGRF